MTISIRYTKILIIDIKYIKTKENTNLNNKCKKIAIIIYNINELTIKNPGATNGGGTVVAQNLHKTLRDKFNCYIDIYSFFKPKDIKEFKDAKIIDISELISDYTDKKLKQHLDNQNYDRIITISPDNIFRGKLIQTHSLIHKLKNEYTLLKIIKYIFLYKKIKKNKKEYENLTRADKFIAVSYKIKNDYLQNYKISPAQIKVAYPGCKKIYSKLPKNRQKSCFEFGIVANSAINKGGHLFLVAAGLAKLISHKEFKITIIAPKFKYDIILQTIVFIFGLKNNILVLPKQTDMSNFYKNIEYIVLPSRREAFGLVALEAMSYGKPALVSDTAGCAEIINFHNGFTFRRNSFLNLVNTIIKLINIYYNDFERYNNLCKNAHKTSLKYSWINFCKQILE